MLILAIDPGNVSGWAMSHAGAMVGCGVAKAPTWAISEIGNWEFDLLVVERPQVYPDDREKANNLITLAMTAGRFLERYRAKRVLTPHPREWKGSVPKPIHNRRTIAKLTQRESGMLPGAPDHNMLDAIGLLLWAIKR